MCLHHISNIIILPKSNAIRAYKVVRIDGEEQFCGPYTYFVLECNKDLIAHKSMWTWEDFYPASFHAFTNLEDAKKEWKDWDDSTMKIIEVLLWGQITYGSFTMSTFETVKSGIAGTNMRINYPR